MKINIDFMKSVFQEALEHDGHDITAESEFEDVPGWDSLGHMKIISEIEKRLNLEFDIDEIVGVDTVNKLIDMIKNKME